jgi:hypothetical protein
VTFLRQSGFAGESAKRTFGVANLERRFIPTNGAGGAMDPARFDRSRRRTQQLTEVIAYSDLDSDSDVIDGHLALARHLGHVG